MTGLADTFPYTGAVNLPSYPVAVSATAPTAPVIGSAWFDTSQVTPVKRWPIPSSRN